MRKLSHGAKNVGREFTSQLRRHTSSSNQSRRAESSGPVARRRSDSKTATSTTFTVDPDIDVPEIPHGLGLSYTNLYDDSNMASDIASISESRPEVIASAVPEKFVAGCMLTKSTRKKKVDKYFFLDTEGTTISWMGTMSLKFLHIDNIKSIRTGKEALSQWHAVQTESVDVDLCFIINYASSEKSNDIKTLHLIAHCPEDLTLWVETLDALTKHREDMMTGMMGSTEREAVLRVHWDSEIKKADRRAQTLTQGLNLAAVSNLCRKLHIHCPKDAIADAFSQADVKKVGLLEYEKFLSFVRCLRRRTDILPIFEELKSKDFYGISRETFLYFLEETQGIEMTAEATNTWNTRINKMVAKFSRTTYEDEPLGDYIDFNTFAAFLSSRDCRVYETAEKTKSLDKPLTDYFISTSHNTYLLGRQVNGTSSVEAYVTALRHGCRSVEIDCWDGENNNPRVTHGFTRTTSVNFEDVCYAINRCAFDASPYPVILSLEVHCNPAQQLRMVEIMTEVFKERLVRNLLPNHLNDLPSPEELKYKILVKVKATEAHPNLSLNTELLPTRKRSTSSPYRRPIPMHSNSSLSQTTTYLSQHVMMSPPESTYSPTDRSVTATSASSDDDSDSNIASPVASEVGTKRVKTSKITPPLAVFGTYFQGFTYRSPKDLTFEKFNHIFSLNENAAMALCKDPEDKRLFEEHNMKHMCRVYPKGLRVNSSNFDPNTFWRRGVQMVALNCQTYDTHMQMNQAMFAAGTDQSGYVLKPEYLRKRDFERGSDPCRFKLPRYDIRFSVKIISAQQLPRLASMSKNDTIDPFIEVQMFSAEDKAMGIANGSGGEGSSSMNDYHGIGSPYTRRTKVVRDNGYNPQFNDTFELSLQTKYPELVFVRFIVYQAGKNSRQLAVFTSKLDSLQRGYRHLPLYNSHGEELIFSTLFCKITKRQPVLNPNIYQDTVNRTPRQRTFLNKLSRNLSAERGRQAVASFEEQQDAMRRRLNREIEERAIPGQ